MDALRDARSVPDDDGGTADRPGDYGELSSALVSGLDLVNATLRVAGKRGGRTVRVLSDESPAILWVGTPRVQAA